MMPARSEPVGLSSEKRISDGVDSVRSQLGNGHESDCQMPIEYFRYLPIGNRQSATQYLIFKDKQRWNKSL
jgi:hypothetical protein